MKIKFWRGRTLLTAIASTILAIATPLSMTTALEFPQGPSRQPPQSTAGGGTRGNATTMVDGTCDNNSDFLIPLLPIGYEVLKTASPNPTFFLYVPKTKAEKAEFLVLDSQGRDVYVGSFATPAQGSIMKISLPETVSLRVGETYTWQFSLFCDPNQRDLDESITGAIERIELDDEHKARIAAETDPIDQATLYAEQQMWPETLLIALGLRETHPEIWEQLMESVGLKDIASEPIAPCCPPETEETVGSEIEAS
ncbi:protein of unknown function DUF928 [Limnospira maxima CS-328]|uniref:DUF928 domain-containing protein n=2 Tax=Limnospira TaxID=2596745 RepID=B5VYR3_LIMMA|nr:MULTISPECIES: DUF928 domain-containing protein [Limnospira]EDZ95683.1 protein of unknown function DUF928 [Limnospira maxima CS-328]MBD2712536.1 DUF928 domain-containing protein [Arthrospira platensis FACHB-835]MDT9233679.1 DUF928 domain-containing protein [Limnospira sp. PMC 917.15]MDT9274504.1 DUF928 domain-containing protein [Limnospira sp. PMC 737.11]